MLQGEWQQTGVFLERGKSAGEEGKTISDGNIKGISNVVLKRVD